MRTPVSNALTVVDQFPQGKLIVVPGVGHSVLTADLSFCAQRSVRMWILGTLAAPPRAMCPRVPSLVKILGQFPTRPTARTAQATLAVASKAMREAEATWLQTLFASSNISPRGLYGGRLKGTSSGGGFTLTRYSIAPGVLLTGKITNLDPGPPFTFRGTVRVTGSAVVSGTLRFDKGSVSGTLGGRRVKGKY